MREYALYKGDEFICLGTLRQIADYTGLDEKTIRYYGTKAYRNKWVNDGRDRKILIKIEED